METNVESVCGKEAGLATNRPCDPGEGFYEVRTCEKTGSQKIFMLTSWNIEERNECWPELGYTNKEFNICQAAFNAVDYYSTFYMNWRRSALR